jgi:hypothetical protein
VASSTRDCVTVTKCVARPESSAAIPRFAVTLAVKKTGRALAQNDFPFARDTATTCPARAGFHLVVSGASFAREWPTTNPGFPSQRELLNKP